jgi:hypothetical protein
MAVDTNIFTGFACVSIDPLAFGICYVLRKLFETGELSNRIPC